MLFFNAIFLLMAISINRNVRLQQENQLLSMQQQRYESLKAAIEEARRRGTICATSYVSSLPRRRES